MVRGLISFVAVSIAVIVQITIVDRIAFPGGAGPDVVLLAVAALALAGGPMTGVLIGFWAGLALDVAPPGSHFVGQNALVFCLIGYACGLAADVPNSEGVPEQGRTALFEIVVTAAGAVLGEALAALLGAMLSDPRVTWSAIRHVLPVAIVYDVLLCPFVLYACAAALRLAGAPRGERSRAAWSMLAAGSSAGATQGAIRAGQRRQHAAASAVRARQGRGPGRRPARPGHGQARAPPEARPWRCARRGHARRRVRQRQLAPGSGARQRHDGGRSRQRRGQGQVRIPPRRERARRRLGWARGNQQGPEPSPIRPEHLAVRPVADGPVAARRLGVQPLTLGAAPVSPRREVGVDRPVALPGPLTLPGPLIRGGPLIRAGPLNRTGQLVAARLRARPPPHHTPNGRPASLVARRLGHRVRAAPVPARHAHPADRRPAQDGPAPAAPALEPDRLPGQLVAASADRRAAAGCDARPAWGPDPPACTCRARERRRDGGQEVTVERVVAPPSRGALRARRRDAGLARRPALLPAGAEQHLVHQAGRAEPDPGRDRARGPRPDPRRRGQPAGHQPDGPGRLGRHDDAEPAARRRDARPETARPAARHVVHPAERADAAVHQGRAAALLGRVSLPAHPGGPARLRPGGAAGHGGAEPIPRRHRAGSAGHRLPRARRGQPGAGPGLPAADHPAGDRQPAPAGDRLLRRGPGRPGRPGGPVRQPAARQGRDADGVGQRRRRRHRHRRPDLAGHR